MVSSGSLSAAKLLSSLTRACYAWSATFGHELHAAPLGANFLPLPGGHFGVCGSVHDRTILRALTKESNVVLPSHHHVQSG